MIKETVCVVMSTYNGEKYVKEQIESILNQRDVDVQLYIRDDGSKDNTVSILNDIATSNANIHLQNGKNIGYARSFLSLLQIVGDYQYYAFADQDDVWKDDKLTQAIKSLRDFGDPNKVISCYWSNLTLVDKELNIIGEMQSPKMSDFEKGRYLIDKYGYGCTMVFSAALKNVAVRCLPNVNVSHDNWIGLAAVFLGKVIYDERSFILYRQHDENVVGGNNSFLGIWRRRIKNAKKIRMFSRADLAKNMLESYRNILWEEDILLLEMVANYKDNNRNKMLFFRNKQTHRASKEKDLIFRFFILLSLA